MSVRHPAAYSSSVLEAMAPLLEGYQRVLDPFAGTGRIHTLDRHVTVGTELEPEWATMHPRTLIANALRLPFRSAAFDAVATSPCYGNRMADHHEAKDASRRNTYRHAIERPLHPANAGALQWGSIYRDFHLVAWDEATRVLRPGGRFVLNCSDHIRKGQREAVTEWHVTTLCRLGLAVVERIKVSTPRQRHGANAHLRVDSEDVVVLVKP